MTSRDDDLTPRPGRIRDKSFVGQVMRAARKAGHTGRRFGSGGRGTGLGLFLARELAQTNGATLLYTAGDTASRTYNLNSGAIQAASGATITYTGTVVGFSL